MHPCFSVLFGSVFNDSALVPIGVSNTLATLRQLIHLDPIPMSFIEQRYLPERPRPKAWIDPFSEAKNVMANEREEGCEYGLPVGLRDILAIADIVP